MEDIKIKLLALEDSPHDMKQMHAKLIAAGYWIDFTHVVGKVDYIKALTQQTFDIIISEFELPGINAFDSLHIRNEICPDTPFICLSGSIGEETAIELLKQGAVDYVLKDSSERLPFAIKRALEESKERAAHHKAVLALKESETRFRQVAETAHEWIWEVDKNGLYTYASPVVESLLGYTPYELVRKKYFYDLYVPEKKAEFKEAAFKVFLRKEKFRLLESQVLHKYGYPVVIASSGRPFFDEQGCFSGFRGVDEDITLRKKAELSLQAKTENFSRLLEISLHLNDSVEKKEVFQNIVNRSVQLMNLGSGAIYLIEGDSMLLKATHPIIPPDFPDEYISAKLENHWHIKKAVSTKSIVEIPDVSKEVFSPQEKLIVDYSGFKTLLYLPLINEDVVIGVLILASTNQLHVFTNEEINLCLTLSNLSALALKNALLFEKTNQKVLELKNAIKEKEKIEKNLQLLNKAIEASSVSVIITNAEGGIIYTNPFFSQITGYSKEEAKGQNPNFMKSGTQSTDIYQKLWETILSGDDWEGELQNKRKNGELFWEKAIISPIMDSHGKVTNFIAIKEDISYRKQAEETRKQLEVARKTAKFKQDFLAKMSHEIRTPLSGVLGMIEVLEQTLLADQQIEYVKDIKTSGENLKEIINQVLEYSKIEAGKITLHPIEFEFKALLEDAKVLYRDSLNAGVDLIVEIDPKIPSFVEADRFRLSQVVNNFVSNAIKFTHRGLIILKAHLEKAPDFDKKMVIKIEVSDTGIGIPDSLQKKLFNPFVQSEDGERNVYEGTGLGLTICKELVEIMKGEVGAESTQGEGSTFWFSFLAKKADEVRAVKKQPSQQKSTIKLRVLLAEDMLALQKITKLLLNSMGHEVHLADNGQQALEIFKPEKFDLLIMDVNMPVMDGVTATQILREKYKDLPPIIGLSANAFEGDYEKYIALGMDDYLTKPFNKIDFERILPRLLRV